MGFRSRGGQEVGCPVDKSRTPASVKVGLPGVPQGGVLPSLQENYKAEGTSIRHQVLGVLRSQASGLQGLQERGKLYNVLKGEIGLLLKAGVPKPWATDLYQSAACQEPGAQ